MQHISLNLTEDPICNMYSELGEIFDEKLLAVASVCHGYTAGRDFSHRTRTRKHHTRYMYGYILYRNLCGV